jgi:hypothetical protein
MDDRREQDESAESPHPRAAGADFAHEASTPALIAAAVHELKHLAVTQVELARQEVRDEARATVATVAAFAVSGAAAFAGVTLLFVTAIFGLARVLPGWAAGLIVAGFVLAASAVVGAIGWRARLRAPLSRTRQVLERERSWRPSHSRSVQQGDG